MQNYAECPKTQTYKSEGKKLRLDANEIENDEITSDFANPNLFAKRSVPLIRTVFVLKAITDFKRLRVQRRYLDNDNIDMIDVGIKTIDIQSDVSRLNRRMEGLERKIDVIVEKLEKL